jgi:hypothetical protein
MPGYLLESQLGFELARKKAHFAADQFIVASVHGALLSLAVAFERGCQKCNTGNLHNGSNYVNICIKSKPRID